MSCLSRLVGLICVTVPGLLFLAFSARFFFLWPKLGFVVGPFYSLASLVTGIVCLYLGLSLFFGSNPREANVAATQTAPESEAFVAPEPVAAPMPEPLPFAPAVLEEPAPTTSIFARAETPATLDTPETRIRRLAAMRPNWQVTAPQLAQLANLNMGVADATAREMARNGEAQIQIGPNGETVYLFDLSNETNRTFE